MLKNTRAAHPLFVPALGYASQESKAEQKKVDLATEQYECTALITRP